MADNTTVFPAVGGDTIATDELTSLNGSVLSAPLPKAQRVRPVFGPDGVAQDVDATHPLPVVPSAAGDGATTLTDGRKTVTTPGTAVALVAISTPCKWVIVTALPTNTQVVSVGGSGTLAAAGTLAGTPLAASQSMTIPVANAATVFIDARVAAEGVSFTVGA